MLVLAGSRGMRCAVEGCHQSGGPAINFRLSLFNSGDEFLIRVEGSLSAEGAAALRRKCRSAENPIRLDLSGLKSADFDGIDALRSLAVEGAQLTGASPYVLRLLEEGIK